MYDYMHAYMQICKYVCVFSYVDQSNFQKLICDPVKEKRRCYFFIKQLFFSRWWTASSSLRQI